MENGTTVKSNDFINEFNFESYDEKPSMQVSGFDDVTNTLPSNYDKLKYVKLNIM